MTEIKSNPDSDSPRPWFDFTFDENLNLDIRKVTGLSRADWTNAKRAEEQALVSTTPTTFSVSEAKPKERHALLVDTDGSLKFVPFSEQPATCYAHLAFYSPENGNLDTLTFINA